MALLNERMGNHLLYNFGVGGGAGADLYGTEPWSFYAKNLVHRSKYVRCFGQLFQTSSELQLVQLDIVRSHEELCLLSFQVGFYLVYECVVWGWAGLK